MKKWNVTGRIDVELKVDEVVHADTEEEAANIATDRVTQRVGVTYITDDELYCEEIEEPSDGK